jgi:hypothetical protein
MQISKRTRFKFGEFATAYSVLRDIDEVFMAEDFEPVEGYEGMESGMGRSLVAGYFAGIDYSDTEQVGRLIRVLLEGIDSWGRDDEDNLVPMARGLIRSLQRDGVPVDDDGRLTAAVSPLHMPLSGFDRLGQPEVVQQHLDRIAANIEQDPPAAIGSCKEMVESVCKFILLDYGVEFSERDTLLDLYKKAAKELKLSRESVPGSAKGSEAAHRVLQNLATAVQSLAELRNELGLGHGRTRPSPAFARHARLAFNAARAVVEFMLETWHERHRAASPAA